MAGVETLTTASQSAARRGLEDMPPRPRGVPRKNNRGPRRALEVENVVAVLEECCRVKSFGKQICCHLLRRDKERGDDESGVEVLDDQRAPLEVTREGGDAVLEDEVARGSVVANERRWPGDWPVEPDERVAHADCALGAL